MQFAITSFFFLFFPVQNQERIRHFQDSCRSALQSVCSLHRSSLSLSLSLQKYRQRVVSEIAHFCHLFFKKHFLHLQAKERSSKKNFQTFCILALGA